MATQYDPIAKDGSLNTTEATPRNIADVLAEGLKGIEDALPPTYTEGDGIDISNNEISVDTTFAEASTRANIASGDTLSTILGKIKKFFTDLKTVAFTGAYSDLSGTENVAVKDTNNQFSANQTVDRQNGTVSTVGKSYFTLGNNIPVGTDKNSYGIFNIYGNGAYVTTLDARDSTANREIRLPDKSGTVALKEVDNKFSTNQTIDKKDGTASSIGNSILILGNSTPSGTDKNSRGCVSIFGNSSFFTELRANNSTANRTIQLPDASGTIALTSDLTPISLASATSEYGTIAVSDIKQMGNLVVGNIRIAVTQGATSLINVATVPINVGGLAHVPVTAVYGSIVFSADLAGNVIRLFASSGNPLPAGGVLVLHFTVFI